MQSSINAFFVAAEKDFERIKDEQIYGEAREHFIYTEIENFLSLYGNTTVHCGIRTSVNEP